MLKPSWSSWLSTHVQYCGCAPKVKSSILDAALFFILYNNNNSDKLDSLYLEIPTGLLLDSYWTPCTGLLLDSYWNPCTGPQYTHSLGIRNS